MAKGERTLIMTNLNDVKPVNRGSVEVSADGQARTVDITGEGPDGKPYQATYHMGEHGWRNIAIS